MKTHIKFILCVAIGILFFSTASKAQGGSASTRRVIDSLKITDPDEIALCNLYDDAVTEYLTELKAYTTNGAKPTPAQSAEVSKRFQQKQKEIQPQIESFKRKVASNYAQLMNFVYFVNYETTRIYGGMMPQNGMSPYSKGAYPGYPVPANH
jgi:hypothetical protein